MISLLKQIKSAPFLPQAGSRILLAVSGGADSVAMLLLLNQFKSEYHWHLSVAHVNHGLRPQAEADALFVKHLAASLGLDFMERKVKVTLGGGQSPEEAARLARRGALLEMRKMSDAGFIALAHHADDQAETLLMRVINGTGPSGLAGMRLFSPPWWRPLLYSRGASLHKFLTEQKQDWREDHTNRQVNFMRNRVRLKLLPLLREEFNPNVVEGLSRLAGLNSDEEDYWQGWAMEQAGGHLTKEGGDWLIKLEANWGIAQKRRFLRFALNMAYGQGQHTQAIHIEQLISLSQGEAGKCVPLPGGWLAWKESKCLALSQEKEALWETIRAHGPVSFYWPAQNAWYSMEVVKEGEKLKLCQPAVYLPLEHIAWPLCFCAPRAGMRFHAFKKPGSRKINWLLQDLGIPRRRRNRVLLLSDENGPWWLAPIAPAARMEDYTAGYNGPWLKIFPLKTGQADEPE